MIAPAAGTSNPPNFNTTNQNKKIMKANTLKAIVRHGETLLRAFPNATEKNPVALCKKLRRIENSLKRPLTDCCNGENGVTCEMVDAICERARVCLKAVLGVTGEHELKASSLFINRDPRGYALKIDSDWVRQFNQTQYAAGLHAFYNDMGGDGILAPDLTN